MNGPILYRGVWPQNVSRLAKYAVRFIDGEWKITVLYEAGEGLRYLAVQNDGTELADRINAVKIAFSDQPGGAFYINEYRHILVPVSIASAAGSGSHYYFAGRLSHDLVFEFEGKSLSSKAIDLDGNELNPGDSWVGPRPGIPYVLAAGGADIYYKSPALTEDEPPQVRPSMMRKIQLSKVLRDKAAVGWAVRPVANIRGYNGGRFYVNENGAMFSPKQSGDGNGLDYIYCGQIDPSNWFPEPTVSGADI